MKFSAIFTAIAAATVVNAQGYNSTSKPAMSMTHVSVYDSRTVNVPAPSAAPTTAITKIYTITSSCGSVQIYLPATSVYPLSTTRVTGTYSTGAANPQYTMGALAGMGGLVAAALML